MCCWTAAAVPLAVQPALPARLGCPCRSPAAPQPCSPLALPASAVGGGDPGTAGSRRAGKPSWKEGCVLSWNLVWGVTGAGPCRGYLLSGIFVVTPLTAFCADTGPVSIPATPQLKASQDEAGPSLTPGFNPSSSSLKYPLTTSCFLKLSWVKAPGDVSLCRGGGEPPAKPCLCRTPCCFQPCGGMGFLNLSTGSVTL